MSLTIAFPSGGGKKRKSRSESGECSDIPAHRGLYDRIPAPEVTPLKLYSPPKAPKYSQKLVLVLLFYLLVHCTMSNGNGMSGKILVSVF